jgi:hypothetical protein
MGMPNFVYAVSGRIFGPVRMGFYIRAMGVVLLFYKGRDTC